MTGTPTTVEWRIDWRMGRLRPLLPISVHSVALWTALELAHEWPLAWAMVVGVLINAVRECRVWIRERAIAHTLALIPGGIEIDTAAYYATRAWFGPRCTAAWLRTRPATDFVVCGTRRIERCQSRGAAAASEIAEACVSEERPQPATGRNTSRGSAKLGYSTVSRASARSCG